MSFNAAYIFKVDGREVVIQHRAPNDKFEHHLRVNPHNHDDANHEGGQGDFARWKVKLEDAGTKCRLQSVKTGKFLRIQNDKVDVGGGQGPFTLFVIKNQGNGVVKLESNKFNGKYIAVRPNQGVAVGVGGKWCDLKFLREGGGGGGGDDFTKPYLFKKTNKVVIMHKGGGSFKNFLRCKPGNTEVVDNLGGKGDFAQFEADPQDGGNKCRFKSVKSGKYLRIMNGDKVDIGGGGGPFTVFKVHRDGNGPNGGSLVKLESTKFNGKYIAVGQNNEVRVGVGGPWCQLQLFRQ